MGRTKGHRTLQPLLDKISITTINITGPTDEGLLPDMFLFRVSGLILSKIIRSEYIQPISSNSGTHSNRNIKVKIIKNDQDRKNVTTTDTEPLSDTV